MCEPIKAYLVQIGKYRQSVVVNKCAAVTASYRNFENTRDSGIVNKFPAHNKVGHCKEIARHQCRTAPGY